MDLLKNSRVIPDVLEFIDVIKRKKRPERVHFIELFLVKLRNPPALQVVMC